MTQGRHVRLENQELDAAIAAFRAAPSPQAEQRLCDALGGAALLLPLRCPPSEGEAGLCLEPALLGGAGGGPFLIGFTEEAACLRFLSASAAALPTIALSFPQLTELILHPQAPYRGILINPGEARQHLLSREALAAYCGSALPVTLAEQTQLMLGRPSEFPQALGAALSAVAQTLPAVARLWLLLKLDCSTNARSFLILLDQRGGDLRQICDVLGQAAAAALPAGAAVEFLPHTTALAETALRQQPDLQPFYARAQ